MVDGNYQITDDDYKKIFFEIFGEDSYFRKIHPNQKIDISYNVGDCKIRVDFIDKFLIQAPNWKYVVESIMWDGYSGQVEKHNKLVQFHNGGKS